MNINKLFHNACITEQSEIAKELRDVANQSNLFILKKPILIKYKLKIKKIELFYNSPSKQNLKKICQEYHHK